MSSFMGTSSFASTSLNACSCQHLLLQSGYGSASHNSCVCLIDMLEDAQMLSLLGLMLWLRAYTLTSAGDKMRVGDTTARLSVYLCEVHEMLEAGVEVGFFTEGTDAPEVGVVDVSIHPEKPLEDRLHNMQEIWWKRVLVSLWEEAWIVNLHTSLVTY